VKKVILISLIVLSLLFVSGCSTGEGTFNNPYSGTCPQAKDYEDCSGECGQFIDTNEDGLCDRGQ
jgi:hypothetical protein